MIKKTAENTKSAEEEEEREKLNNSDTNGKDTTQIQNLTLNPSP